MSGPSRQQITDAIIRVHKARREFWPPAREFKDAEVPPRLLITWAMQWGKAQEGWIVTVEGAVEKLPLVVSAEELERVVSDLIAVLEQSAHDFRMKMMETLDDEESE